MYRDIEIDGTSVLEVARVLTSESVGYTISRAAKILNISKQSVDHAIQRDALHATRIFLVDSKGNRKRLGIEVDRESVHEYARQRHGRERIPYGYVDDQLQMFG
jgi:hypothetical protein